MRGVICSGNMVVDLLVRPVDRLEWGATTLVESIEQHLGGNGSNTAYTLGMLGVPVRALGMVGGDDFGRYVLAQLAAAHVDTGGIRLSAAPTAASVALVRSGGERLFLHRAGASADVDFTAEEIAREFCSGAAHYHLASPFGLPRLRPRQPQILARARAAGLTTSIDTHWDSAGLWLEDLRHSLPHTDILFANEDEARMLTGATAPEEAAARLQSHGARSVVLKLGRNGCAVFHDGRAFRSPAFGVPVVDTTGAGDCFAGAFLAALARGLDWPGTARFANAVAALAVQRLGAVEGVLGWDATLEWMRGR